MDTYIERAADFAKPILKHLRETVHTLCPRVEESVKWGIPHFEYCGQIMCMMAAHSRHCSFSFWKEAIMSDARLIANPSLKADKRFLGCLKAPSDLPPDPELSNLIREAMKLNEDRIELPKRPPKTPAEPSMPQEFQDRLAGNEAARQVFESRSPSFRKEYLVWIGEAKTAATRERRIVDAIDWISEGKSRFWNYQR